MRTIQTIDCHYLYPQFAAAYLMKAGSEALFVDNNTTHSVPLLLDALKRASLAPEQVRYVIITHVHLDHAGGTSALMKACPNATLLAHPKAAIHMIDPSRLTASARKVYGDAEFERLYGEILPVAQERTRSVADGESIDFGGSKLEFFHTRGHANHHFCIFDRESASVFTGDSFGLAYPALQRGGLFIFPSTSPTDFDAAEAKLSVAKIIATGSQTAYLTHFGAVTDLAGAKRQLDENLDWSQALLERAFRAPLPDEELQDFCLREIRARFERLFGGAEEQKLLELDLELNAAGLAYVAKKKRGGTISTK
jgi:glyoxylase-like metal-dependent hydrolase (beta-lactamase superfamily II)